MRLAKAMNRIAALVISTILLTQIASYSYGDIPSQIEWEEPLKGDPDWKVTGRNSTGNQTGNNTTTAQITIEMDYAWGPWYSSGSTATAYINSTDLTINKDYRVGWELEQLSPTTSIVDYGNFTWTATSTTDQRVVSLTPPDGSYLAWAWLHEVVNSTSQSWIDTDATNFTVGNNSTSTGGNNTGGNSSTNGCGNMTSGRLSDNWNFTEVQEDTLFDYVIHADCLLDNGTEYEILYQIWYSNGSSPAHAPFTWQAQLINYNETWTLNVSDLNPGTIGGGYWMFVTRLFIGATTVDQITHDYCVNSDTFSCNGSNGNNTSGNNSMGGSQTNPIMPTNCSRIDWNLTVNVTIDDCINGTSTFWFELQNNGSMVWIDPDVAVGYDYIVYGGPKISGVNIPVGYGDDIFDLFMFDSVTGWYDTGTNIDAGTTHVFNPPTDNMSIRGIETSELLDPTDPTAFVSGLTFETNGTVVMTMTPVTETVTCGDIDELAYLSVWTDYLVYDSGESVWASHWPDCYIVNGNYTVESTLYGPNGIEDYNVWNFSGYLGGPFQDSWDNLDVGYYCINATMTKHPNIHIDTTTSCFNVVENNNTTNNSNGHIFIESIWTNWSSSDSHAMGEVQDIDGEWTAYWGVYDGEYSFEDFGNLYLWDNSTGWWQVPAGSQSGEIGTLNSSGEDFWGVENMNTWAAHPVDVCGTFVIALFEGNIGDATGQTTPATTYPISYDSMVFGPEGCGSNDTTDHSIEMVNYPQYTDCVLDSLTINATLYDPHNVSGGETNLTIVINQYIYDSNGDLDDDLSSQAVMVVSTNISFDMDGFGFINEEISTATLSDGEYGYTIVVGNMTFLYVGYSFEVGCSGCGYNSSLITSNYEIWSYTFGTLFSNWDPWNQSTNGSNSVNDDTPQIYQGDTLSANVWFSCMVYGEDYLANLTVTNDANLIVFSEEESITQDTYSTWYSFYEEGISTDLLPTGEYCLTFTLYVSPFGSSDVVYTVTECVEIVSLEDWDGCGTNLTYLQHLQDVNGNPFVQQGTVFLTTSEIWYNNFVDCLVIGENYTMVSTVTHDGSQYMQETDNFTVNQFSDVTQWSWVTISNWNSDAPVGNYCVETTIHSTDSTYTNLIALVSTVTDCFAVVEITPTDWWGDQTNNSTGSPNNPIMPDTNCTNLSSSLSGLNLTNAFNLSDCENGTGFWFNLTVNGTGVNWYDPVYAVGYDFEVLSGPKFASVVVPPGYGDDKYDIYLWDGSEYVLAASDLDALTQYWFTDDGQITTTPGDYDGITMFSIRGLELDAKLDPDDPNAFVTGLTFVQDPNEVSEVVLSMNPIRVSDEDDDGIADADDNCVDDANTDQADADGDGIGDVCDTAASGGGKGDGGTVEPDSESDSDSNRTLAYAALLAVALVGILVMFGREDER